MLLCPQSKQTYPCTLFAGVVHLLDQSLTTKHKSKLKSKTNVLSMHYLTQRQNTFGPKIYSWRQFGGPFLPLIPTGCGPSSSSMCSYDLAVWWCFAWSYSRHRLRVAGLSRGRIATRRSECDTGTLKSKRPALWVKHTVRVDDQIRIINS